MESFVYQSAPSRVVFGQGALAQLPDEMVRLGAHVVAARRYFRRVRHERNGACRGSPVCPGCEPDHQPDGGGIDKPAPVERAPILALLGRAWRGGMPA